MVQIPTVKVDLSVTFGADVGMCTLRRFLESAMSHTPWFYKT